MPWAHPDGTNHWYEPVAVANGISWADANLAANLAGGYLATITSSQENSFVFSLVDNDSFWCRNGARLEGPWLGGVQPPGSSEPGGGWRWAENEPFGYQNWGAGLPNNVGGADCLHFGGGAVRMPFWSDLPANKLLRGFVIERSGSTVPRTVGLQQREPGSFDGYSLFAPLFSRSTYLIDPQGRLVNTWVAANAPGLSAYLLPNGDLLRPANVLNPVFTIGGCGGLIERYDWGGGLVWSYGHSTNTTCQHHDAFALPNGNVIFIAWDFKTSQQAVAAGRDPQLLSNGRLVPDKIVEVQPTGPTTGQVVWEWNVWDHLIQDFDASQAHFGNVGQHPELVDINFPPLGHIGGGIDDWMHSNAVTYNPDLDQVMLSVRHFSEFWIIDHSTTMAEAASHTGGRSGHGGDLLYRWGNPEAYRAGTPNDRQLFQQHNAHWIEPGLPGAGNVLVFNNGLERPGIPHSTVVEVTPPTPDSRGNYPRTGPAFGPAQPTWVFQAADPAIFNSIYVGGAQRLPNGNTLICSGWQGFSFEVGPSGQLVWLYTDPVNGLVSAQQGQPTSNNQLFRMTRYAANYAGLAGKNLRPGDPIEQQAPVLRADGSTIPTWVHVGGSVALTLKSPADAGLPFLVGTSVTEGLVPVDYRFLRVGFDPLLVDSMSSVLPSAFQGYVGWLDPLGAGMATLSIPPYPWLAGFVLHSTYMVLDPAAPSGVRTMVNDAVVRIVP
jgi:hypothetical protein